jgi:hypothetical protein
VWVSVWLEVVERHFVQRLYSRFALLAFLVLLATREMSNLRVFNTLRGFDSRRLHHIEPRPGRLPRSFASLRISPAGSDARKTAQVRLPPPPPYCF